MQKTFVSVCLVSIYLNFEMIVTKCVCIIKSESKKHTHHIKNVNVALKEKQTQTKQQNDRKNQTNKQMYICVYTKDKLPWRKWFGRLLLIFSSFFVCENKV